MEFLKSKDVEVNLLVNIIRTPKAAASLNQAALTLLILQNARAELASKADPILCVLRKGKSQAVDHVFHGFGFVHSSAKIMAFAYWS